MNYSFLLFGILPLLIFVIVDTFFNIKAALISTILVAIIETIFGIYLFGEIDSVTIFSLITVVALAFISYRVNSSIYLKFQPVILSALMGIILIISFAMGKPLLYEMSIKYQHFYPQDIQNNLQNPLIISLLKLNTIGSGLALIIHSVITAYAALKLSNWWWIIVRGVGFYLCILISMLAIKFIFV